MVVWTRPAIIDLQDIYNHIAKDSSYYAKKVAEEIRQKAEQAEAFPLSGKIVPEINNTNVREFHIYSYRIMYEIKNNGDKEILTVTHQRQNFKPESSL